MNERVADQNDGGDLRPGSSCLLVIPAPGVEGIGSDCFDEVLRNMDELVVQMNPPIRYYLNKVVSGSASVKETIQTGPNEEKKYRKERGNHVEKQIKRQKVGPSPSIQEIEETMARLDDNVGLKRKNNDNEKEDTSSKKI